MHFGRTELDITNLIETEKTIMSSRPHFILNAAAYTSVDMAEKAKNLAYKVNSEAVHNLATIAKKHDIHLIHFSTDYVFDGCKEKAYTEEDIVNPQSIYGKSKADGEKAIFESGCVHTVFRTSWVYSVHGNNFDNLEGISSEIYGAPAVRPANSCLSNDKLMTFLSITCCPSWAEYADQFISLKMLEVKDET